jgi:AcrR family transcriptional regulator
VSQQIFAGGVKVHLFAGGWMKTSDKKKERSITRKDWVAAARKALIENGISGVRLRALSECLSATTGAFYWQYKNLEELLDEVRQDWAERNTAPFAHAIEAAGPDGWNQYLAYVRVLVLENDFDPLYDNAIRDWAHSSRRTADVLRDIEIFRIEQLKDVFRNMGFDEAMAMIRARVTYFHQTGYNAMKIIETMDVRLSNIPYYAEILTDRTDLLASKSPAEVKLRLEEIAK